MPSHLRLSTSFPPVAAHATYNSTTTSPSKKQKMSLTQTYYVASTARSKLGMEAGRPDHNLRLLVGHANLLDSLMVELADAEREQEAWFNQSVKKASKPEEPRHIQWIDTIREEEEEDEQLEEESDDDESDAGSEIYDEDEEMYNIPVRSIRRAPIGLDAIDDADFDDEFDDEELSLTRTVSNHSPPELDDEYDSSDSEDESMPASPEQVTFELTEKQRQAITTTNFYDPISKSEEVESYLMTTPPQQPMIAAC